MSARSGRFWVKAKKRKHHDGPDRAVLLCRQSITKHESISLDDQEARNRSYAEQRHYTVAAVHRSPNVRGWKEDRIDHDAIRQLAAEGEIDVVVSYDVSRTARTVRILENLAHDLEEHGVRLEFSAQEFANTTQGRQLLSLFAETETTARSIRLTDVWDYLRRQGRWHGRAPYGYARFAKSLIIDPNEEPHARQIIAWGQAGKGSTWIVDELVRLGIPTRNGGVWSQKMIVHLLRNPAYAGGMVIDGESIFPEDGASWHEPYLPRPDWDALQAILPSRPAVVRRKPVSSWLEGLIEHACGQRMHLIGSASPRGTLMRQFRCSRRYRPPKCRTIHAEVSAQNVERAVRAALLADIRNVPTVDEIERAYIEERKIDGTLMARRRIQKARDAISRRKRGVDLILQRDDVAEDDKVRLWQEGIAPLNAQLAALDAEESALPSPLDTSELAGTSQVLSAIGRALATASDDGIALALRRLRSVAVVGEGGVRIRYPADLARFIPSPAVVKIPRARTK